MLKLDLFFVVFKNLIVNIILLYNGNMRRKRIKSSIDENIIN